MYEFYVSIKAYHIGLAVLSVTIFSLRGILMLAGNSTYKSRWFRLGTPLIDTVLLILGVSLAVTLGELVFKMPWFVEKMVLLVLYIVLGTMALKRLSNKRHKNIALVMALACAAGMFHAALTKQSIIQLIMSLPA